MYAAILLGGSLLTFVRASVYVTAWIAACRRIHDMALWTVLRAPMSYLSCHAMSCQVLRAPMSYFDTTVKVGGPSPGVGQVYG